ncbi:hypothetical protein C2I18_10145 [Paenibacillus sp. PK3_47]|uniref:hypothetical protein n=1 Tax=Paenibacillus sp. PK3_47 TaxID=2072642 RepID=UPI00201D713D|nr:hypothetical protein [Paenibacillus sp. PK3_47]UQZ33854.1 hypothetical protein C2I18_10145 [Paenibacillus sp. PK3_47]
MVAQLLWIAAVYGSAVALVHILQHRKRTRHKNWSGKRIHYLLITRNHEAVVEWYIRGIGLHAFLTGQLFRVTVMDDGSMDGTLAVASRLALNSGGNIEFAPVIQGHDVRTDSGSQHNVVVDLRLPDQLIPLSFLRMPGSGGYGSKHSD